jgi:GNAT superfamily N-acetyltransferase
MASDELRIRAGGPDDEGVLFDLFDEAVEWLVARGQPGQWGTEPWSATERGRDRIHGFAHDGGLWIAERGGEGVGALALGPAPEWVSAPERAELYVNLLITSRAREGSGIGGRLLGHAVEQARAAGVPQLRVDCWAGSPRLVAYYEEQGFTRVERFQVRDFVGQVLVQPL